MCGPTADADHRMYEAPFEVNGAAGQARARPGGHERDQLGHLLDVDVPAHRQAVGDAAGRPRHPDRRCPCRRPPRRARRCARQHRCRRTGGRRSARGCGRRPWTRRRRRRPGSASPAPRPNWTGRSPCRSPRAAKARTASRMSAPDPITLTRMASSHPASHASSDPSIGDSGFTAALATRTSTSRHSDAARHSARAPCAEPRSAASRWIRSAGVSARASRAGSASVRYAR